MKQKKEIQEELEKLSPNLSRLKKENPFKVPVDYFEKLPEEILRQVKQAEAKPVLSTQPSFFERIAERLALLLQPKFALALTSLALAIAFLFLFNKNEETDPMLQTTNLAPETIQTYLADNIDDIDEYLLYELDFDLDDLEILTGESWDTPELEEYLEDIMDDLDDHNLEEFL